MFHFKEPQLCTFIVILQDLVQPVFGKVEPSIMHLRFEKGWNVHKMEALVFLSNV